MTAFLRRFAVRLHAMVRRGATDRDVDDELQYHLDRDVERLVANGARPDDALRDARRAFGNATAHAESAREQLRWLWLEQLAQDARYALRSLRATPAFTAVAALSLTLGVGANVAILSTVDALLLRRLPVRAPEELVGTHGGSYSMYKAFRTVGSVFSDVAAVAIVDRSSLTVAGHADGGFARVALATGNYFSMLGVGAFAGRTIAPDDDRVPGGHPVAVISYRYWRDRLDGARDAVGRPLVLNATTYTIIGIAARDFGGDAVGRPVDVWIPMMMQSQVMPEWPNLLVAGNGFLRIIMRMKPGLTVAQAQAAIQPAYRAHEIEQAGANATAVFRRSLENDPLLLVSIARGYSAKRDDIARGLGLLLGVVTLVLVIACTNVATLLLVRAGAREREMAVRAAIGAGRARLARQVLTEAILLSVIGGVVGVLFAWWSMHALSTTISIGPVQLDARAPSSVQSFELTPRFSVYAIAGLMTLVAGILFGIAPAIRAARGSRSASLLGRRSGIGGTSSRGKRTGTGLVVAQIALSVVLLAGTGLLVRSLRNLRSRELGIDRSHLLLVWAVPAQTGHAAQNYPLYVDRVVEHLSRIPGVAAVSATNHGLLEGSDAGGDSHLLTIDGEVARAGLAVMRDGVAANFFATTGMTLIAGRDFRASDDSVHTPVAVMNETMARHFFGNESAIGKRLGTPRNPVEIIGVVKDARHGSPRDARGVWYVSYKQFPGLFRSMCIVVRASGNPAALRSTIQSALRTFDPLLPVLRVDTVGEQLDDVLFQERMIAAISLVFAALAAVLACIGLYGVMAYAVARRSGEIGVRVALGATRLVVVRMVVRESVQLALVGVALGIPGAILLSKAVSSRLYGVGSRDPATLGLAAGAMLIVALLAGLFPAQRAASIDPAVTLRTGE